VVGVLTPAATKGFAGFTTPGRILVATILLLPLGFVMGTAFPLGLKQASRQAANLTPWLWGVNGATSVCGSVLAVMVSLGSGISACFWTGFSFYSLALCAFACAGWQAIQGFDPKLARPLSTAGRRSAQVGEEAGR